MTRIILFLLLAFPFLLFGQKSSSIDLVGGIGYSYRGLQTHGDDYYNYIVVETRKSEIGILNWIAGFNYNLKLSEKTFLRTGLRIINMGNTNNMGPLLVCGMGLTQEDWEKIPDRILTLRHRFYEVPLVMRYNFSQKKLVPFFEIGISPAVYVSTRSKTQIDSDIYFSSQDKVKEDEYHRYHLVSLISLGVNYTLTQKIQLFAQPVFRYHLTNLNDSEISENLFSTGVEVGIRNVF